MEHKTFNVTLTPKRAGKAKEPVKLAKPVTVNVSIPYVPGDAKATADLFKCGESVIVDGFLANTIVQVQDGIRNAMLAAVAKNPKADVSSVAQAYVDERMKVGRAVKVSRLAKATATVKEAGLSPEAEAAALEAVALALGKKGS